MRSGNNSETSVLVRVAYIRPGTSFSPFICAIGEQCEKWNTCGCRRRNNPRAFPIVQP